MSDARFVGGACIVAAVFVLLSDARADRMLEPAVRFFAGLAAGGGMLLASRLLFLAAAPSLSRVELAGALAWSDGQPLTTNVADASGAATRAGLWASALIWLVAVLPALVVFAAGLPLQAAGEFSVVERGSTERFTLAAPVRGTSRWLGAQWTLGTLASSGGAGWTAGVEVSSADGAWRERATLELGDAVRLDGLTVVFSEVTATAELGGAVVSLTDRSTGEIRRATLRVGERFAFDDARSIELVSADTAFLGQLGPALEVIERTGDTEVRREWVFHRAADFDIRHGSGTISVTWEDMVPQQAATFQVTTSPLAGRALAPFGLLWLAMVMVTWWRGSKAPGWVLRRGDQAVWIGFSGLYPGAELPEGRR